MTDKKFEKIYIDMPTEAAGIIGALKKRGFEAFAVGGSVRDALLGKEPSDWDITTSATPGEIKKIFVRTVDTGIKHGTVTVLIGKRAFEVTTYRTEGQYTDKRHPDKVEFTDRISEDLKRRDFTVNAMAYDPESGLLDLCGGKKDLEAGIIRAVGDPDERFSEDALRILRAVRFAAQLDFVIEDGTRRAIAGHAAGLGAVSRERIAAELIKLITSAHIERVNDLFELGLAPYISEYFSQINLVHLNDLKNTAGKSAVSYGGFLSGKGGRDPGSNEMRFADGDRERGNDSSGIRSRGFADAFDLRKQTDTRFRYVRFAFLLEGTEPDKSRALMSGLKPDNITMKNSCVLAEKVLVPLDPDRYELKKNMSQLPSALFEALLMLKAASSGTDLYKSRCADEDLTEVLAQYMDIIGKNEPVYLSDLDISGADLIGSGFGSGPGIGAELKLLHDLVLREPAINHREMLLKEAQKHL